MILKTQAQDSGTQRPSDRLILGTTGGTHRGELLLPQKFKESTFSVLKFLCSGTFECNSHSTISSLHSSMEGLRFLDSWAQCTIFQVFSRPRKFVQRASKSQFRQGTCRDSMLCQKTQPLLQPLQVCAMGILNEDSARDSTIQESVNDQLLTLKGKPRKKTRNVGGLKRCIIGFACLIDHHLVTVGCCEHMVVTDRRNFLAKLQDQA